MQGHIHQEDMNQKTASMVWTPAELQETVTTRTTNQLETPLKENLGLASASWHEASTLSDKPVSVEKLIADIVGS